MLTAAKEIRKSASFHKSSIASRPKLFSFLILGIFLIILIPWTASGVYYYDVDLACDEIEKDANRKTEIDFMNDKIYEYGRKLGIPTPYNDFMLHATRVKELCFSY